MPTVLKETSKIKNVIEKQMVVVTMIDDHDHDVHDDDVHDVDDDDDVTDCEEVSLRGRTRTNAPSESLTAADWLKRALSAR